MFEKDQEIRFGCTQCGKCCEKPPRVNFFEMLELADKFIFQTAHHTMISYAEKPLDKALLDHYQIIGHTIMMPELEASLFYFIDFIPVPLVSYKSCPQLKDNLCQIYGQRPGSCKLNPISAFYDSQEQWKTVNFFKERADKYNWQCSFDEKDPIIFKNGDIYSPALNALYHQEVVNIREITDKYIEFLSVQEGDRKNDHFKALFNAMQKNALIITDVVFMLQAAIHFNLMSPDLARNFIIKQKNLIEKELAYATTLKNKDNLPSSRLYKKMIEDYKNIIDSPLFRQNYSEDFQL